MTAHRARSSVADELLAAHERGLSTLPLRPGTKEPHFELLSAIYGSPKTKRFQRQRPAESEIRAWLEYDPRLNYGIVTGEASGGLAVLDFDVAVEGVRCPETPVAATSRGQHIYLRAPASLPSKKYWWGEVRANGDYVAAPPSLHPSGRRYSWVVHPDQAPLAHLDEVVLPNAPSPPAHQEEEEVHRQEICIASVPLLISEEEWLWARDEAKVAIVGRRLLGIEAPVGTAFRCVLPGHHERRPSASLYRDPRTGEYRYRDWHNARHGTPAWLTLPQVYAAQVCGRIVHLPAPTTARWYMRMAIEAELVEAPTVELAPLPPNASSVLEKVADGFRLVLQSRQLREDGPAPFTRTFAETWCGVGERQAGEAIVELLRLSVMEKDRMEGRMSLFKPGLGRARRMR